MLAAPATLLRGHWKTGGRPGTVQEGKSIRRWAARARCCQGARASVQVRQAAPPQAVGATGPLGPRCPSVPVLLPFVFLFWSAEKEELIQSVLTQVAEQFSRYRPFKSHNPRRQMLVLFCLSGGLSPTALSAGGHLPAGAAFLTQSLCDFCDWSLWWGPGNTCSHHRSREVGALGFRARTAGNRLAWLSWDAESRPQASPPFLKQPFSRTCCADAGPFHSGPPPSAGVSSCPFPDVSPRRLTGCPGGIQMGRGPMGGLS